MSETGSTELESRLVAVTQRPRGLVIGFDVGGSKVRGRPYRRPWRNTLADTPGNGVEWNRVRGVERE